MYIYDIWNVFDLFFIGSYIAYIPTSFLLTPDRYWFKVLECIILIATMIKLNSLL